jgi:hypothetical protein
MVTTQKMLERKMGNRGSKSIVLWVLVSLLIYALSPYISFILSLVPHFNELLFSNSILLAIFPFNSRYFSSTSARQSQASSGLPVDVGNYSTNNSVVPVKIYRNADLDKLQIVKENRGK